jgi:uncharacterized repeat protein (TIGR03803 family)
MKSELLASTANDVPLPLRSALGSCRPWWLRALAFVGLLGLFAVPSSAHGQTFSSLYSFPGGADGAYSYVRLVRDSTGNLYGTTWYGGAFGDGTVFELTSSGKETVLYSFTSADQNALVAPSALIRDAAGNLYGTTQTGGDLSCSGGSGCGLVFKLDSSGKETVLYSFSGGVDGGLPVSSLVRDAAGNLYGTAETGGDLTCAAGSGCGVVFKVDSAGKETVLYSFSGKTDGETPKAAVVRDTAGNLYGTTLSGGNLSQKCAGGTGCGTVFKLTPSGKETVLYSFKGGADGQSPSGVIRDAAGNFYGTTFYGGTFGGGTVFKLNSSGKKTLLYSFPAGEFVPVTPSGVIRDAAGNLYGTTVYGGDFNCSGGLGCGTVFKVDATGKETVLYTFAGSTDGAEPSGLIQDKAGNLYGTTVYGGDLNCDRGLGCGTVFKIIP